MAYETYIQIQVKKCVVGDALGLHENAVASMSKNLFLDTNAHSSEQLLQSMRRLPRDETAKELKKLPKAKLGNLSSREILDALYAIPHVVATATEVLHTVDKESGNSVGTLRLKLEIDFHRERSKKNGRDDDFASFVVLLGTCERRMLLAQSEFSVGGSSQTTFIDKELNFDWKIANADAGEGGGFMILRILQDRVRGMDIQMEIKLR